MNAILLAVGILTGIGLVFGLVLAFASVIMAVPRDEKVEQLRSALPGANCGACGFSGCDGYAEAMVRKGAKVGLCSPGGTAVAEATAAILGVKNDGVQAKTALVRCGGCEEYTTRKLEYHGLPSCAAANQFYGGNWACNFGCLGYGDCREVCQFGAITVKNGLASIDPALCTGCGMCVKACPKSLILLVPGSARGVVRCLNRDKGAATRKLCSVGCIGCMRCVKACKYDAIHVADSLATITMDKCVGCGACADSCPVGCITIFGYNPAKAAVTG